MQEAGLVGLERLVRLSWGLGPQGLEIADAMPPQAAIQTYEPGFLHVDLKYLPQMADETTRRYLFVAIDRATCRKPGS